MHYTLVIYIYIQTLCVLFFLIKMLTVTIVFVGREHSLCHSSNYLTILTATGYIKNDSESLTVCDCKNDSYNLYHFYNTSVPQWLLLEYMEPADENSTPPLHFHCSLKTQIVLAHHTSSQHGSRQYQKLAESLCHWSMRMGWQSLWFREKVLVFWKTSISLWIFTLDIKNKKSTSKHEYKLLKEMQHRFSRQILYERNWVRKRPREFSVFHVN